MIPNEQKISGTKAQRYAYMAKLKRMGFTPGASDLCLVRDGRAHFIEVKRPHGKQSQNQILFERAAGRHGSPYVIIYSAEEMYKLLKYWDWL